MDNKTVTVKGRRWRIAPRPPGTMKIKEEWRKDAWDICLCYSSDTRSWWLGAFRRAPGTKTGRGDKEVWYQEVGPREADGM